MQTYEVRYSKGVQTKVIEDHEPNIAKWALAVKERDSHKCVYCGATDGLHSHHIFSRKNKSVVDDIDNGITLCMKHHTFSKAFSAHGTPEKFIAWLIKLKGEEWYDELRRKARSIKK